MLCCVSVPQKNMHPGYGSMTMSHLIPHQKLPVFQFGSLDLSCSNISVRPFLRFRDPFYFASTYFGDLFFFFLNTKVFEFLLKPTIYNKIFKSSISMLHSKVTIYFVTHIFNPSSVVPLFIIYRAFLVFNYII